MDDLDRLLAELDGIEDPRGPVPRQSVKSQMNLAELDRLVEDFEQAKVGKPEPKPQAAPASPKPQPIVQPATPTTAKQIVKPAPKTEPEKFDSSNYSWRHEAKGNHSEKSSTQQSTNAPPSVKKTPSSSSIAPTQPAQSQPASSPAPITKSASLPNTSPSQPEPSPAPITKSSPSSSSTTSSSTSSSGSVLQPTPAKSPDVTSTPTPSPATLQPTGGSGIGSKDTTKKDIRHSKSVFALKPINPSDVCASCGYNVKGEHIVALGKIFHMNHFTCSSCGLQLSNDFFEHEGKPSCNLCMEKYYTCCKCGKGIEAEYFEVGGLRYHASCLDRGSCARCGKGISSAETTALGKNYHPECFTCYGCGGKLEGTFYAKNNEPYCPRCASSKAPVAPGGLVACAVCKQQITGTYITFNHENYHSQCFTCSKCNQPLPTDSFYIIKQQFHCEKCAKA